LEEWSALQGWELQYLPLKPRGFEACFRDLELPRTVLQREHWSSGLQLIGTIRGDLVPIAMPIGSRGVFQGLPFNSGDLIFMKPGSDLNLLVQSPVELFTLHVPKHDLERVGVKLGIENPMDLLSGPPVVDLSPSFRQNWLKSMLEFFQIPAGFMSARKELESQMLGLFWESLKKQDARKGGLGFSPRTHFRYVKRAQEFIEDNLEEAIRIEELAAASDVSARALQLCFRDHFQMGPQEYVRLRRLHRCHKALQRGSPDSLTVTDVAMKYGFYHLGRFSMYYKSMFGESPSWTLRSRPRSHIVSVPT
jgi:AraC family ethanolamine operon transcriptional activator